MLCSKRKFWEVCELFCFTIHITYHFWHLISLFYSSYCMKIFHMCCRGQESDLFFGRCCCWFPFLGQVTRAKLFSLVSLFANCYTEKQNYMLSRGVQKLAREFLVCLLFWNVTALTLIEGWSSYFTCGTKIGSLLVCHGCFSCSISILQLSSTVLLMTEMYIEAFATTPLPLWNV